MAKELPYFRFTAFEWLNDDISLESYELKGLFIDICSYYWFKDCSIDIAILEKRFSNAKNIQKLINLGIIKINKDTNNIEIKFLNDQYDLLSEKRKKRQEAGKKGGLKKSSNAKAMLKQKGSYKDKDKDKIIIDFSEFWNKYHKITKKPKTDKDNSIKYWNKLTASEQKKAINNIFNYSKTQTDNKYLKKARTYLSDKNFNDEFEITNKGEILLLSNMKFK